MTRGYVQVTPDSTGKKIAVDRKSDGADTVEEQIVRIGGEDPTQLADVRNTTPGVNDYGLVVRSIGTLAASDPLVISTGTTADAAAAAGDIGTIQAKLRLMTSQLATIVTSVDGLEGFTDGLEGLLTSLNGFVDGLESALAMLLTDAQLRATAVPVSLASVPSHAVTGPLTDAQLRATAVPVSGATSTAAAAAAAVASVAGSATNVTLIAANASRRTASIFNDSTAILYLKLGATASATSHTAQVRAGGLYELLDRYVGVIDGLWASAVGSARTTETT